MLVYKRTKVTIWAGLVSACFSPVGYASYQDGAWALFVVLSSMPILIVGFILTVVLCVTKKFVNNKSLLTNYSLGWGIAAVVGSAICRQEFFYGLFYYSWFLTLILLPPLIQYKRSKRMNQ